MFKRLGILVIVSVFLLLMGGMVNAKVVDVVQPNGGESIGAGSVYKIKIDINWAAIPSNARIAKYILHYTKNGGTTWNIMTTRSCRLSGACTEAVPCCPEKYYWEVPLVSGADCKVRVKLIDERGALIAKDVSDSVFTITSFGGIAVCGNGILEGSEECDDGNNLNGDGCSSLCKNEI
jgi:cysteine-rich repeat protein